jgi:phosphoenolpyruvate-protein phosphotransferase (PTS system enzyme I)
MSIIIKGKPTSEGLASAISFNLEKKEIEINNYKFTNIDEEIRLLDEAIEKTKIQLSTIKEAMRGKMSDDKIDIFNAHIDIATDPSIKEDCILLIKDKKMTAVASAKEVFSNLYNNFSNMEDEYFKERANDIKDVSYRFMCNIVKWEVPDLSVIKKEVIVVAEDIFPSDIAQMNLEYIKGFVTFQGGKTSHTAIMARTLSIPAITSPEAKEKIKNNEWIIINGNSGEIIVNPDQNEINEFNKEIEKIRLQNEELKKLIGKQTITKDGKKLYVEANIGKTSDLEKILKVQPEGVGLFRTEFLYMDSSDWPTEEEQYQEYKKVVENTKSHWAIIRTLDIGGDKDLKYYKFEKEMNPFLGNRAIRFCLNNVDIFKVQLRALLRASAHGQIGIMFPMIATVDELIKAKEILKDCEKELDSEGIVYSKNYWVGIMIEIPSTAVMSDVFAKHVDFFSIGTNDLIQYTMAADRISPSVGYLYQPLNPSVLRLINMTIQNAIKNNITVAMCGEMASDKMAIPLLVGMGLTGFSMSANHLQSKNLISKIDSAQASNIVKDCLEKDTEEEVKKIVKKYLEDIE